jgi:hypothetical protein
MTFRLLLLEGQELGYSKVEGQEYLPVLPLPADLWNKPVCFGAKFCTDLKKNLIGPMLVDYWGAKKPIFGEKKKFQKTALTFGLGFQFGGFFLKQIFIFRTGSRNLLLVNVKSLLG